MSLDAVPIFAMLKARMGYETQRQRVLSENVANSDTPGFAPRDLKGFTFASALQAASGAVRPALTQTGHMAGRRTEAASAAGAEFKPQTTPDGEAKLDGNQVVLEEEMMKMSDSRGDYDAAVTLYQQSLNMLRTAARAPGR